MTIAVDMGRNATKTKTKCFSSVNHPRDAAGWSVICEYDISWSYPLVFCKFAD